MAVFAAIAFAAFLLENDDFVTFYEGHEHLANYFCAFESGGANFHRVVGLSEENAVEFNLVTFFNGISEIVNIQELVRFSLELLSLNFNDCVHLVNKTVISYYREARLCID